MKDATPASEKVQEGKELLRGCPSEEEPQTSTFPPTRWTKLNVRCCESMRTKSPAKIPEVFLRIDLY